MIINAQDRRERRTIYADGLVDGLLSDQCECLTRNNLGYIRLDPADGLIHRSSRSLGGIHAARTLTPWARI